MYLYLLDWSNHCIVSHVNIYWVPADLLSIIVRKLVVRQFSEKNYWKLFYTLIDNFYYNMLWTTVLREYTLFHFKEHFLLYQSFPNWVFYLFTMLASWFLFEHSYVLRNFVKLGKNIEKRSCLTYFSTGHFLKINSHRCFLLGKLCNCSTWLIFGLVGKISILF